MADILNKLHELVQNEMKSPEPRKIPRSIYKEAANHIKSFRSSADETRKDVVGRVASKEREMVANLAHRLIELRLSKMARSGQEGMSSANLTAEEKYVLEPFEISGKRMDRVFRAVWNGQASVLDSISEAVASRYVLVRFLQPLPATIGADLIKYGPFQPEDVAMLPAENAKPLIKQGLVQEVWVEGS